MRRPPSFGWVLAVSVVFVACEQAQSTPGGSAGRGAASGSAGSSTAGNAVGGGATSSGGTAGALAGSGGAAPSARKWRILPIGDSITESDTGYRGHLYEALVGAGYDVDFLGSRAATPAWGGDPDHDGRGGHTIGPDGSQYCQWDAAQMKHVCNPYKFNVTDNLDEILKPDPDFILLLLGVNDLYPTAMPASGASGLVRPVDPKQAPGKLATLVQAIATRKPNAKLLVSSLLRQRDSDGTGWTDYLAINAKAKELGEAKADDNVLFVDLHAIALDKPDFVDGLHPSDGGGAKVAGGWLAALTPLLGPPPRAPRPALWEQTFASAPAAGDWTLTDATIGDGKLTLGGFKPLVRAVYAARSFAAPYALRVRLAPVGNASGNTARVLFDWKDDQNHRFVELAGGADAHATLGEVSAGTSRTVATSAMPFTLGAGAGAVEVRRTADAVTVLGTKGGKETTLIDAAKLAAPATGSVGAQASFNSVDVDWFVVRPLP